MKAIITSVLFCIAFSIQAQKTKVMVTPNNLKSWASINIVSEYDGKHKVIIYDQDEKKVFEKKINLQKDIPNVFKHNFSSLKKGTYRVKLIRRNKTIASQQLEKKIKQ